METLIIIIVIVLVIVAIIDAIAIHINFPDAKFDKAVKLQDQNRFKEAQDIYLKISKMHPLAITKYSECFFQQAENLLKQNKNEKAIAFFNKVIESKGLLSPISDKQSFSEILSKSIYEIAQIQFKCIPDKISTETIRAYKNNLEYINQSGFKSSKKFIGLVKQHNSKIANIYYKFGLQSELRHKLINAKVYYLRTIKQYGSDNFDKIYYNAIARIKICDLKFNLTIDLENISLLDNAQDEFRTDFYYRYAISLIKRDSFIEAEKILRNKLDKNKTEIKQLLKICESNKIINANKEINEINKNISRINKGNFSTKIAVSFYDSISKRAKELSKIKTGLQDELESIKPSLFNRLLKAFSDNEEYGNLTNLIVRYPKFYTFPALLKNLGNACLNYLRTNTLKEKNYKILIALFLTSAYSDKVMLYSLEETIWDDEYTFSLSDSIGASYELHSKLPENVNYDDISDSNISIGESQRFLISQFETLLNKQDISEKLLKKINIFYDSEKYAIEKIIEIIPNEIFFTTPYFAEKFKLNNEILAELVKDYEEYGNEDALEIGELYNFKGVNKKIYEFSKAKIISKNIIRSIERLNKSSFELYIPTSDLSLLRQYSIISNAFENKLFESLSKMSKVDAENEYLLNIMQSAINISQSKYKLKYLFAHYASNLCVSKVNSEKISNYQGLKIMKEAYICLPNDFRVCTNIITLIKMNIMDELYNTSQNSRKIYSILDYIKENRSATFKNNVDELIESKTEILNQLSFETKNAIKSGGDLNSQEKKYKKALYYLGSLGGDSIVNNAAIRKGLGLDLNF